MEGVVTSLFIMFLHSPPSGYKSVDSVPKLVEEYMNRRLKVDQFVTHTLPFDKISDGFDLMHAGKWYAFIRCAPCVAAALC